MPIIQFALRLENACIVTLEDEADHAPNMLKSLIELAIGCQKNFYSLIGQASRINANTEKYPIVDPLSLVSSEADWRNAFDGFTEQPHDLALAIVHLWTIYELFEKSGQFYQQAALNSPYPAERLFYSSLAEAKKMLKRRLDSAIRVISNEIWGEIGFAPFALKD